LHWFGAQRINTYMSTEDTEKSNSSPSPSPVAERLVIESAPTQSSSRPSSPPTGLRGSMPAPARHHTPSIPPSPSDELRELLGSRDQDPFSPEEAIDEQIAQLEAWAWANVRAERIDGLRFWGMRVLAFLGVVGAAVGAGMQQTELAVGSGVLAAFAIVVDTAWPATGDRIARRRAVHDLRELQHSLRLKWDKVRLCHPNPNAPKRVAHALVLLDQIHAKREEIGRYLGEASPTVQQSHD